jgi:prepilin-type N-terminal cleavage/methylation domain-containing protein
MKKNRPYSAFSLIELLTVVAIIGILAALTIPAASSILAGRNLTTGANMLVDQLVSARQAASAKNARIRWHIISTNDPRNGDSAGFRRMQAEIFDPVGRQWSPSGRAVVLPLTITADPLRSTLLTNQAANATNSIEFLPGGRTAVPNPSGIYSITLHNGRNTNNFVTIQIDPVSGRCRTFQP